MKLYELTVNGLRRSVEASPTTPLLWVIRDSLGLPGTKYGCGIGACGACTVHLDGRAVFSCTVAIAGVGDAAITTIEGISSDGDHPVQMAWLEEFVSQCGYCQAGQIMSALVLLTEHPDPTDEQIDRAMRGNLCRCGTYQRIRRAIRRASTLMVDG